MRLSVRPSLLQLIAVALLALQWTAATHAADHVLEPAHELCALCHIAQDTTVPPTPTARLISTVDSPTVADTLPASAHRDIAWASRALRGPPQPS